MGWAAGNSSHYFCLNDPHHWLHTEQQGIPAGTVASRRLFPESPQCLGVLGSGIWFLLTVLPCNLETPEH